MAERKKKDESSWFGRLMVNLILGANLVTLMLLWLCCAITWIDPAYHARLSVLGLVFPVFLILNLLFLPVWLLVKPRMLLVPLVGMGLCGSYILDYCPISFGDEEEGGAKLTVQTWNCRDMQFYMPDSIDLVTEYLLGVDADILCLQEFTFDKACYQPLRAAFEARDYYMAHVNRDAVVSRFPVISERSVPIESAYDNAALLVDLLMPDDDTLSVICVHLESNNLSVSDKDGYEEALHSREHEKVKSEAAYLTGKLAKSAQTRARQVNVLAQCVDSIAAHHSVMLCGDFNDTPISYAYQHMARRLCNAYRSRGRGMGITFNEKNFPVRIDHIFYSPDWTCDKAFVDRNVLASDHYPVVARLRKQKK